MMKRFVCGGAVAVTMLHVFAIEFPQNGGDFSIAGNWSNGTVPTTGYMDFNYTRTFTASQDFACRLISVGNPSPVNVILDLTGTDPTGTITATQENDSPFVIRKDGSSLTVKGGVWKTVGGGGLTAGANFRASTGTLGRSMTFTDGATVGALPFMYQAGYGTDTSVDVNNRFEITGGAKLTMTNFYGLKLSAEGIVLTNNVMTISHSGILDIEKEFRTDFKTSGSSFTTSGNALLVTDGGKLIGGTGVARIGSDASNVTVRISGTDSSASFEQVRIGFEESSDGNRLEVLAGGALTVSDLYVGRHGAENTLYVSNGTVTVNTLLTMGFSTASCGNTIHFAGSQTQLILEKPQMNINSAAGNSNDGLDFFPADENRSGGGNRMIVSDGADVRVDVMCGFFRRSRGNTLRVTRGAVFGHRDDLDTAQLFSIGRWSDVSSNNTVFVENEGEFRIGFLRVTAVNNGLVISNGTVTCAGTEGCTIGYTGKYTFGAVTNNALVLKGNAPVLEALSGEVAVKNGSSIRFEVPDTGYAADVKPVKAKTFSVDETSDIQVTLDGYFETSDTAVYTLVETTQGVTLAEGVLDAANAAIGSEFGEVFLSADEKMLKLKARGRSGFTVIVR